MAVICICQAREHVEMIETEIYPTVGTWKILIGENWRRDLHDLIPENLFWTYADQWGAPADSSHPC